MSQLYAPSAFNLKAPLQEPIVDLISGFPTQNEQQWRTNLGQILQQISGVRANVSGGDATTAIQTAINQAVVQGGGLVILPAGQFTMGTVQVKVNGPPIWIVGQGPSTVVTRNIDLPPGVGMFDISSSNFGMSDFVIDGGTTIPKGLQYGADFTSPISPNDPMAPSLTNNTSVWVHGGAVSGFRFNRMIFQHAAGYSLLLDATGGDISNIDVLACWFLNNRPTLFGSNTSQLIFGSWNGGLLAKGDGRAAEGAPGQSGVVSNLLVGGCRFKRNNGNCAWSHNYGFSRFNSNFRFLGNQFEDCGLDGILLDVVSGGVVEGNIFRRIGYTTLTDTDRPTPRWLAGLNGTAINSDAVKGFSFTGNSITSANGGAMDLDTFSMGTIAGNVCRIPYPDEPEYVEDQIAITGPTNDGNASYGMNLAVNNPVAEGGTRININGNTLLNLPTGAMRLFSMRGGQVVGNAIDHPDDAPNPPIAMGPQSLDGNQRCYDNRVHGNQVRYAPGSALPAVLESEEFAAFTGGEVNYVYSNAPILGGGSAVEFEKSPTSGSTTYAETVWFP